MKTGDVSLATIHSLLGHMNAVAMVTMMVVISKKLMRQGEIQLRVYWIPTLLKYVENTRQVFLKAGSDDHVYILSNSTSIPFAHFLSLLDQTGYSVKIKGGYTTGAARFAPS